MEKSPKFTAQTVLNFFVFGIGAGLFYFLFMAGVFRGRRRIEMRPGKTGNQPRNYSNQPSTVTV